MQHGWLSQPRHRPRTKTITTATFSCSGGGRERHKKPIIMDSPGVWTAREMNYVRLNLNSVQCSSKVVLERARMLFQNTFEFDSAESKRFTDQIQKVVHKFNSKPKLTAICVCRNLFVNIIILRYTLSVRSWPCPRPSVRPSRYSSP